LQASELWDGADVVVIDSATHLEQLAVEHVTATIPVSREGGKAERIEDYPYGKGWQFLYDAFLRVLADLDQLVRSGKHVILTAHDCVNRVPNPDGEDWIRWEPRLSDPPSGKGSIRAAVREWADHVLCLRYDVVTKGGKGCGHGSRTIWCQELPAFMAKSRSLRDPIPFTSETDSAVWTALLNGKED